MEGGAAAAARTEAQYLGAMATVADAEALGIGIVGKRRRSGPGQPGGHPAGARTHAPGAPVMDRGAVGEVQSNFYISLASGPEDPMLLERLCVYRGFV